MADREYLSIGEVLVALKPEFPDVTISKIRFLESEGLISPERTASGYRKFYDRDVRRLRTILKLQRDEYLPLKVIRERLDGELSEAPTTRAAAQATLAAEPEPDEPEPSPSLQMTADELGGAAGLPPEAIEALSSFGLLRPSGEGDEPLQRRTRVPQRGDGNHRAADRPDDGVDPVPQRVHPRDFVGHELDHVHRERDRNHVRVVEDAELLRQRAPNRVCGSAVERPVAAAPDDRSERLRQSRPTSSTSNIRRACPPLPSGKIPFRDVPRGRTDGPPHLH